MPHGTTNNHRQNLQPLHHTPNAVLEGPLKIRPGSPLEGLLKRPLPCNNRLFIIINALKLLGEYHYHALLQLLSSAETSLTTLMISRSSRSLDLDLRDSTTHLFDNCSKLDRLIESCLAVIQDETTETEAIGDQVASILNSYTSN